MSMENMKVWIEIWPVAADEVGLWLVSGHDAWRAGPVAADSEIHHEVELALAGRGVADDVVMLHSTSWRQEGPAAIFTYIAVLRRPDYVFANWPDAEPISLEMAAAVGKPPAHGAAERPNPARAHCLEHALRHIAFLRDHDNTAAAVLDEHWRRHLADFEPVLAGLYRADDHRIADHRRAA